MAFALMVVWTAKPGHEAEVGELLAELQEHTRTEPGCLEYFAHRTDDPAVFVLYEQFADRAAFDAHRATGHFQRLVEQRGLGLLAEDRKITFAEPL
ncbi:MAG TPA: putative quinol monooxygenase [Baekduia sp.]